MAISFEKLRELQIAEKESRKLQQLPDNILDEIREYLSRKKAKKDKTNDDIIEVKNVKNVIKSIFEKREHKIVELALLAARTDMPAENLLKEEEQLFYSIVGILKNFSNRFSQSLEEIQKKKENAIKSEKEVKVDKRIRIREDLPPFVDKDLKVYSLKKDDVVIVPDDIKNILVKNKKADIKCDNNEHS